VIGAISMLLVVAALILAVRSGPLVPRISGDATSAGSAARLLCCGLYIGIYTAYLIGAALSTSFEPLNSRYVSPVYVPSVVVASVGLAAVLRISTGTRWRGVAVALPLLFIGVQLNASVRDARDGAVNGIGFNGNGWIDSPVAAAASHLVDTTADPVVYSNNPSALWAATGMQPIFFAPRDVGFRDAPLVGELKAFVQRVGCTSAPSYLVFYLLGDEHVVSFEEIKEAADVRHVAGSGDGAVFRVAADRPQICKGAEPRSTRPR
jgi:hypothetical protein